MDIVRQFEKSFYKANASAMLHELNWTKSNPYFYA